MKLDNNLKEKVIGPVPSSTKKVRRIMAQFDFKKFLKEGGIEKYLIEENFGNDIESRYEFIRPLMSRLPDSARTEML